VRKCADRIAYFHAACRNVRREEYASVGTAQAFTPDPTPSEAAILPETLTRFMADLDEANRDIVTLHLQGYTTPEISGHVRRSERTVCRVLERVRRRLRRLQEEEAEG
jgi:RNA polymerase sigma-70 factor (ECF subfamily)